MKDMNRMPEELVPTAVSHEDSTLLRKLSNGYVELARRNLSMTHPNKVEAQREAAVEIFALAVKVELLGLAAAHVTETPIKFVELDETDRRFIAEARGKHLE